MEKLIFKFNSETEYPQDLIDDAPTQGPFDDYVAWIRENYEVDCSLKDSIKFYGYQFQIAKKITQIIFTWEYNMKYKITKKKVIEAVLSEPLNIKYENRKFFSSDDMNDDGKCEVCAVGAVLRKISPKKFGIDDGAKLTARISGPEQLYEAYEENIFMSVLSCEYESFIKEHGYNSSKEAEIETRTHLLSVIEAFCPDVLEFDL